MKKLLSIYYYNLRFLRYIKSLKSPINSCEINWDPAELRVSMSSTTKTYFNQTLRDSHNTYLIFALLLQLTF